MPRARGCSTIAALPSTAITVPSGTRCASTSVTRPVPQPASRTHSSPRRSSRSMTSRAIASCGSDTRSYELASHSRGNIRAYAIAYARRSGDLEGQRGGLRTGLGHGQLAGGVAVGAGPAGDRLCERRGLLLRVGDEAGGDDLAAREVGDVVALGDAGADGDAHDVALAEALGALEDVHGEDLLVAGAGAGRAEVDHRRRRDHLARDLEGAAVVVGRGARGGEGEGDDRDREESNELHGRQAPGSRLTRPQGRPRDFPRAPAAAASAS